MSTASEKSDATKVLDREFLEIRANLIQLAASLDRIDRHDSFGDQEPRMQKIRAGLKVLLEADSNRAEHVQMLFSREFDAAWRMKFEMVSRR